jgi:hypothetical protein
MPVVDKSLFIAVEGTRGTEEAPDAAEVIHYTACDFTVNGSGPIQRGVNTGEATLLVPYKPQTIYWGGTFESEVKAGTAVDTAPELSNVLQAAGMVETTSAGVSVKYTLAPHPNLSTVAKSVTIRKEEGPAGDGNVLTAIGCLFGGFSLSWATDTPLRFSAPWIGQYKRPADLAALSTATYNTGTPLNVLASAGNPFRFHSYDMLVRSISINCPLQLSPRGNGSAVSTFGYEWPPAVARTEAVSFEFEIEQVDQTAFALWSKYEGATAADGAFVLSDGTRTLTIDLYNTVFGNPQIVPGVPNTIRLSGTAHKSGSNTAIEITQT